MAWFKVDDKLHSHRKVRRARKGGDRPRDAAAIGLWVLAGSWAASNETDGFVPADELDQWDTDADALAERLVESGLWSETEQDGEPGFLFHEWEQYQPTSDQLEARRAAARERMSRVRANGKSTSGEVRSTPTRPDPTPKTPAADAAEFETWWEGYPRKIGKTAAAKAYAKARRSASAQELIDGQANAVAVWQAARTEPQFIPHPATWLNQGRWEDQQDTLPGAPEVATRPSITAHQCGRTDCPGTRHEWDDGRHAYMCMGA